MVDKDGNKVNIMEDLIRLEGQLKSYLIEVTEIENQLLKIEPIKDKLIEEFNSLMPDIISEERKKRNKLS
jgi:DNA polymerase III alpha subunit (gram-positive type)